MDPNSTKQDGRVEVMAALPATSSYGRNYGKSSDSSMKSTPGIEKSTSGIEKIRDRALKMRLKDLVRSIQTLETNISLLEDRLVYNREQHKVYIEVVELRSNELDIEIAQLIHLKDQITSIVK